MLRILLRFDLLGMHLRIGSYAFLVFCGALAALLLVLKRSKEARLSPRELLPVFIAAVVAGFLGARAASLLQNGTGGLVLYGGLLAGFATGLLVARWKRLPALAVADLAAPVVLLAAAFGRAGCVLAGCCYGVVCDSGLSYPRGSHPFKDQLRHGLIGSDAAESLPTAPIVLFEAFVLFALFLIASELWRRKPRSGTVLAVAGLVYPAWRFVAEFWRADNQPYWPGNLTFSQGISLALIAASAALLFRKDRPAIAPASLFRPATAFQMIFLLAAPGLSLGSLSCGSHQERHSEGVHVYRNTNSATQTPPPPGTPEKKKSPLREDDNDNDCFGDCIVDCTGMCISGCLDAACGKKDDDEMDPEPPQIPGAPAPTPVAERPRAGINSILDHLQPGTKYRGALGFEAVVNKRLEVLLKLEGTISVGRKTSEGARPIRLRLRKASLKVGDARWTGEGEVDLLSDAEGVLHLVRSTLPADLMNAVASLNALSGNLIRGATTEEPLADLSAVVQEELRVPEPQAGFSFVSTFEGQERWVVGDAKVVEDPPGTFKLNWKATY